MFKMTYKSSVLFSPYKKYYDWHVQPLKPPWQHLTLNSNESSLFSSLTLTGRQSYGTMREVNQIPVMVLTSGRGQGPWLEGARRGQLIGWEVSALKETKVMCSWGKCNGYTGTKVLCGKRNTSTKENKNTRAPLMRHKDIKSIQILMNANKKRWMKKIQGPIQLDMGIENRLSGGVSLLPKCWCILEIKVLLQPKPFLLYITGWDSIREPIRNRIDKRYRLWNRNCSILNNSHP